MGGVLQSNLDLEGVNQQPIAVFQCRRITLVQRCIVEQHAVGAAILNEIHPVEVANHRVDTRHARCAEHPVAIFRATDTATHPLERLAAPTAKLGSLAASDCKDQAMRHRHSYFPSNCQIGTTAMKTPSPLMQ